MVKAKTVYVCSNCGADSPKWIGKCPSCGEWNTYVEEIVVKEPVGKRALYGVSDGGKVRPVLLRDITSEEETRVDLGDRELNRVLGGGLITGLDRRGTGYREIDPRPANRFGVERTPHALRLRRGEQSPVETPCRPHRARESRLFHSL